MAPDSVARPAEIDKLARHFRGEQIRRRPNSITKIGDRAYEVQSQAHPATRYRVFIGDVDEHCNCPDNQRRWPNACKHILAVCRAKELGLL